MKKLFGTDGIRAEAGQFPLDADTVAVIGYSLAKQLEKKLERTAKIITGRDTRESGEWIEAAFHKGVLSAGASCESADVITTPGVAFLAGKFGFDAGVVISASHNPFQDNGIKIFSPTGEKIDDETERAIEADIFASRKPTIQKETPFVQNLKAEEYKKAYLGNLLQGFEKLNLKGFKMIVDCANGASSHMAYSLFSSLGADVMVINNSPNGKNINANCGSLHIESLKNCVLQENADFGVAYDGDADRAIFIDEKGNVIDGDASLYIMARFMKERNMLANETVVATVMSNIGLEIALAQMGIKLIRTAVGDKYVLEELLRTKSRLGGEQSGHIIFPFRSLAGDGMLTTLFILQAIYETGKKLSSLTEGFKRFPQVLINVKVREKVPFEDIPELSKALEKVKAEVGEKGRILLRYSGTENLARIMIEGEDEKNIRSQAEFLARTIENSLN
ncbi:MAG: phosphoglucosamine mutase [Acidobacteria bacterium]|nr:MAG: phosphoglucosamine mutase [Acidobacteriota bacterium]GIU81906.1 MAG: phosphoglucosamine mutase [Pyrinomonadaceae bacterium]